MVALNHRAPIVLTALIFSTFGPISSVLSQTDTDQFTYQSQSSTSPNNVYGPDDWDKVGCNNLTSCLGWPDKYEASVGWKLESNTCRSCSADGNSCGNHHQSPINLERNRAINESQFHYQCVDDHLMRHFDSSCTWDELVRLNAFSIERHALKIAQPLEKYNETTWRNACRDAKGHRFGRMDFSAGYADWWYLSHMNLKVPSEHTQEGKRYDAEMQFPHFYSVRSVNEMATLSIYLQAYDDAPDYDMLNKIICQWRHAEDQTREQCGLPSVESYYPGCFYNRRGHSDGTRNLRSTEKAVSAHDVMVEQTRQAVNDPLAELTKFEVADDFQEPDINWEEFIRGVYEQEEVRSHGRHLIDYDHIGPWNNYFGMFGVKTEFYHKYSGTQTIPPCYGPVKSGSDRVTTNQWRIMKDPIRVSERQIDELHRLLKDRIAPSDDPIRACQSDTAAASYEGNANRVNVSRPLQMTDDNHYMAFCECRWGSYWDEDRAWCKNKNQTSRLYDQPYNFVTDGF